MNRYFEDTVYYLKRAVTTARKGVSEELAPVEGRVRELTGREEEPEPSRVEAVRSDVRSYGERAKSELREAVDTVRGMVGKDRGRSA